MSATLPLTAALSFVSDMCRLGAPQKQGKKKSKKSIEDNVGGSDAEPETHHKPSKKSKKSVESLAEGNTKPRIKLRLGNAKEGETKTKGKGDATKKAAKRRRDEEETKTDDVTIEIAPEPKKKKQKKSLGKKGDVEESSAPVGPPSDADEADSPGHADRLYLDISQWKSERESLDGTFESARALFTLYGPWKLPQSVGDDKFAEVAKATLMKMDR